jgi:hypothetical protein
MQQVYYPNHYLKNLLHATSLFMIEVVVKVSDEDSTLTQKYLLHEEGITLSHDNPELRKMVDQATQDFGGSTEPAGLDIIVKFKLTW